MLFDMDLKRIFRVGVALSLALVLMGPVDAGAKTVSKRRATTTATRKSATGPAVVKGEVKTYGDYLTTQLFSIKKGESQITVEYPMSGNEELVKAVRSYIVDFVNDTCRGDTSSPEQLLKTTIKGYSSKGSYGMTGETVNEKVVVVYSNDNVISYLGDGYSYMGGAHGMPFAVGCSFLVSNGKALTTDMMPPISTMRPYIIDGLCESIEMDEPDIQDAIPGIYEIDYPGGAPYFTEDGLVFHYGAYEIGSYALGMPTSTVSWSDAAKLLSGDAAAFVE